MTDSITNCNLPEPKWLLWYMASPIHSLRCLPTWCGPCPFHISPLSSHCYVCVWGGNRIDSVDGAEWHPLLCWRARPVVYTDLCVCKDVFNTVVLNSSPIIPDSQETGKQGQTQSATAQRATQEAVGGRDLWPGSNWMSPNMISRPGWQLPGAVRMLYLIPSVNLCITLHSNHCSVPSREKHTADNKPFKRKL